MKKILIFILVALLCTGLVACRKAQENAVENMIENMIESQGGDDFDIDIDDDGGEISISNGEDNVSFQSDEDGMAWPSDKFPNNVPEMKGVKVVSVMDAGMGVFVVFEGVNSNIAEDYEKAMENNGWKIEMTLDQEGFHTTTATNSDDEWLTFSWDEEDNGGEVSYGQGQ